MTTFHDLFQQRQRLHQCAVLMRASIQEIGAIH